MNIEENSVQKTPSASLEGLHQGRSLSKGQQTKLAIVDAALGLASQIGLEGMSIGVLAEVMHMSKSGVFAHFGSREELQLTLVREYFHRFEQEIFYPAMLAPRGLERVRALFTHWMKRVAVELQSGCIFISGSVEFDDRPGPIRDALVSAVQTWMAAVRRAVIQAKETGELSADADENQIVFELHGLILAIHFEARFLKTPGAIERAKLGFENLLSRYQAAHF